MIALSDKETGKALGSITEEQFQFLMDQLEEESSTDTDYYINGTMIFFLKERGADEGLVEFLYKALGDGEEMEIQWEQ